MPSAGKSHAIENAGAGVAEPRADALGPGEKRKRDFHIRLLDLSWGLLFLFLRRSVAAGAHLALELH